MRIASLGRGLALTLLLGACESASLRSQASGDLGLRESGVGDSDVDADTADARDGELDADFEDARAGDGAPPDAPGNDATQPDGPATDASTDGSEVPDLGPDVPDAAPDIPDMIVDAADAAPPPPCPTYVAPEVLGQVGDPDVREASGVAESRRTPGFLWVHNDSGDGSRVFALSTSGEARGRFVLDGPRPRDWEDLAIGPGPEAGLSYLYIGDVGDNLSQRANLRVRRFPEPEIPAPAEEIPVINLEGVEDFTFEYPDGAHNCESLMVDPRNGDVYVLVKSGDGISPLYRAAAPLSADEPNVMEQVANLSFGEPPLRGNRSTTASDISPDGSQIIVRTYGQAWLWRRGPRATVGEAMMTEVCPIPAAREQQGEAIGFAADGQGYFTVSEGVGQPVHFFRRE